MNGNSFVSFFLRSPLHGMLSGNTLLITVTGRKTGRAITTPVNYVQDGSSLLVVSNRDRKWWRNLRAGAPVTIRLQGKDRQATAQVVQEEKEAASLLGEYVKRMPISARALSIRMDSGEPNQDDLAQAVRERLMIRIKLGESG